MKRLASLVNSFFFRIFLWFWIANIFLVGSTAYLANQLLTRVEMAPWSEQDSQRFQYLAGKVEEAFSEQLSTSQGSDVSISASGTDSSLTALLRDIALKMRLPMLLIEHNTLEPIYALPPAALMVSDEVIPLVNSPALGSIESAGTQFSGPGIIDIDGRTYSLFFAKPNPLSLFLGETRPNPSFFLIGIVIFSGILCFMLAWSVVKPVRRLRRASQRMAKGELDVQIEAKSIGKDELGGLSRDFNSMATQIRRHVNAQQQLLSDISHELKSPLARQQVAYDLLRRAIRKGNWQDVDTKLNRAELETQRLNLLITQLLSLADWRDAEEQEFEALDLSKVLSRILADAKFEAQGKGLSVELCDHTGNNADPVVLGVESKLNSAFENLIRNALKYARTCVQISIFQHRESIKICVSDDGDGVSDDAVSHIFEPFFRASEARERDTGGVGLGLAIAKKVIDMHGGSIQARSGNADTSDQADALQLSYLSGLNVEITLPIASKTLTDA
ncbi:ATP-binding protein [Ningiella sp. W23]|uniref:ATP-binding protein n=1 Tax=Ningiella sp. W23 TaxID=3023715 RepID=UPI00375684A6